MTFNVVSILAVEKALRLGYRHIETAAANDNEAQVGEGRHPGDRPVRLDSSRLVGPALANTGALLIYLRPSNGTFSRRSPVHPR